MKEINEQMEAEINSLVDEFLNAKDLINRMKVIQDEAKGKIATIMKEIDVNELSTNSATIKYVPPSKFTKIDTKALMVLMSSDDTINKILSPHVIEKTRKSYYTISEK